MKLSAEELKSVAAEWRMARRVYPVYLAVSGQFDLGLKPCAALESPVDRGEPEIVESVRNWLQAAEVAIGAFQLRIYCQTSMSAGEPTLRALILRHLSKVQRSEADRDKIDFLLVQYFSQCAPIAVQRDDVKLFEVGRVLEPVLGQTPTELPAWLDPIEPAIERMRQCQDLSGLLRQGLLLDVRKMKSAAADQYFTPAALLIFARYNFVARRVFFRLMRAEVDAIAALLPKLKDAGVKTLDCSSAELGKEEPLELLEQIAISWKQPFRAEYSSGTKFEHLPKIREAAEAVVRGLAEKAEAEKPDAKNPVTTVSSGQMSSAAAAVLAPVLAAQQAAKPRSADQSFAILNQQLQAQLKNADCKEKTVTRVSIAGHKLILSSWEVRAFAEPGVEFGDAMRSGVTARVLLELEVEKAKAGDCAGLTPVVELAHEKAAHLQDRVAEARDAKDIDAAVTLAATSKRLAQLMNEAEALVKSEDER